MRDAKLRKVLEDMGLIREWNSGEIWGADRLKESYYAPRDLSDRIWALMEHFGLEFEVVDPPIHRHCLIRVVKKVKSEGSPKEEIRVVKNEVGVE